MQTTEADNLLEAIELLDNEEARARAVILHRTRKLTRRALSIAALMNYIVFGRWPGER
jgi:hypothetical protein